MIGRLEIGGDGGSRTLAGYAFESRERLFNDTAITSTDFTSKGGAKGARCPYPRSAAGVPGRVRTEHDRTHVAVPESPDCTVGASESLERGDWTCRRSHHDDPDLGHVQRNSALGRARGRGQEEGRLRWIVTPEASRGRRPITPATRCLVLRRRPGPGPRRAALLESGPVWWPRRPAKL